MLLLTGIASPEQLVHDLSPLTPKLHPLTFSDHHQFRHKDIQLINDTFATMEEPKCIITTEKDVTRLQNIEGLSDEVRKKIYVLPLRIKFMQNQEEAFNNHIISYVRKNSRNSILTKGKSGHRSKESSPKKPAGDKPPTISFKNT